MTSVAALAPLPVAIPFLVAAALIVMSPFSPRRLQDALAIATGTASTVLCALLLVQTASGPVVYWFGGWRPQHDVALGIAFAIDPLGAGLATLASVLVTASLVFSWRYFEAVHGLFHVLMLVFLGAMVGFALTGDIFNMFVFFELMGVAAFALTGYKIEEQGPLQGALNFAITNSVGAFLILIGLGLLYGRTGALNLAQIGRALSGRPADGLVIAAFVTIAVGFFIKAAVVPFHFWLADAEAVAPTPVCVLFSCVMDELGLYAVARIYWSVFSGVLGPHAAALRAILVTAGVVTALLGAVMCALQHHLKRLLAFSTISHVGVMAIAVALLTPLGLAGAALYVLGHALVKGALFLGTGVLLHRFESVDENHLCGRGRSLPWTGILFAVGGLALAGLPPFATFLGKGLIEDAAGTAGYPWVTAVLITSSVCTGGTVLRAAGRIFLGWGPRVEDQSAQREGDQREPETEEQRGRTPLVMLAPIVVLLLGACAIGLLPHLGHASQLAAARLQDRPAYAAAVLQGSRGPVVQGASPARLAPAEATLTSVVSGLGSALGAILIALMALFRERFPAALRRVAGRVLEPQVHWLRAIQSGHIADYIVWIMVGAVTLGGACAALLR